MYFHETPGMLFIKVMKIWMPEVVILVQGIKSGKVFSGFLQLSYKFLLIDILPR